MIAVLAAGAVLSATNPAVFRRPDPLPLLDGSRVSGYEDRYEQSLALRSPAAAGWDLIRYAVFAEGAPGVLVGRDGWLFTTEEFETPAAGAAETARTAEAANLDEQLDAVERAAEALAARGIRLTVALVPAKARVYPGYLGRYVLPDSIRERYSAVLEELSARGVQVADLLQPLKDADSRRAVFMRTDTHWTPHGAQAAARAVAAIVVPQLERAGSPRTPFTIAVESEIEYPGDLLAFIRLGPWFERFGPPVERIVPIRAVAGEPAATGLFDDFVVPVVLTGTSYSAGAAFGFEDALKGSLQADVLNVAEEGRGPFAPMQSLLDSATLHDVQAEVVIWEIPERYFLFPP